MNWSLSLKKMDREKDGMILIEMKSLNAFALDIGLVVTIILEFLVVL